MDTVLRDNKDCGSKKYIIVTDNICMVGGIQFWVSGKVNYLESQGWKVFVLFSAIGKQHHAITPTLDKYLTGQLCELEYPPAYYGKCQTNRILKKIRNIVGEKVCKENVVVESHTSKGALWAELLAEYYGGKHFMFVCNEKFRGPNKFFDPYLDFFAFKYRRGEIAVEVSGELQKLFESHLIVDAAREKIFLLDEDPVQEVKNEQIETIDKADWTICYIGRSEKNYVPNIIMGVSNFAKNHPDKRIQFVILGDSSSRKDIIAQECKPIKNLSIVELGNVVPIPKLLFKKVDVVIAGSGSARCAVYENVVTILANPETTLSSGLLGYDTKDFLYSTDSEIQDSFDNQLERVLVDKMQEKMKFDFIPKNGPEVCTRQNLDLIYSSASIKEYYPSKIIREKRPHETGIIFKLYCKHIFSSYFPFLKKTLKQIF